MNTVNQQSAHLRQVRLPPSSQTHRGCLSLRAALQARWRQRQQAGFIHFISGNDTKLQFISQKCASIYIYMQNTCLSLCDGDRRRATCIQLPENGGNNIRDKMSSKFHFKKTKYINVLRILNMTYDVI